jgi:hypothetical protein
VFSQAPTCNSDVLAIADTKGWSRGVHYWRIQFVGDSCLRRVGVVDGEFDRHKLGGDSNWGPHNQPVLGATAKSWGVSIDGNLYGEQHIHNAGNSGICTCLLVVVFCVCPVPSLRSLLWVGTVDIGLLLDCKNHKLHIYNGQTGARLGLAFSDVKGKNLRPAVLLCHNYSSARALSKAEMKHTAPKALPAK